MAERMCILTRAVRPEEELVRFVRSPDGAAVPDLSRKLPGRGVWVTADAGTLAEVVRKGLFAKGFGAATAADPGLVELVRGLLRKQALGLLSLAKKAGEAVTGFTKVEELLLRGRAKLLIHAQEAAPDGCRKLDKLLVPGMEMTNLFHLDELDLAFGRSNVIHAAVAKGGLAEKLRTALRRIRIYDGLAGPEVPEERA